MAVQVVLGGLWYSVLFEKPFTQGLKEEGVRALPSAPRPMFILSSPPSPPPQHRVFSLFKEDRMKELAKFNFGRAFGSSVACAIVKVKLIPFVFVCARVGVGSRVPLACPQAFTLATLLTTFGVKDTSGTGTTTAHFRFIGIISRVWATGRVSFVFMYLRVRV